MSAHREIPLSVDTALLVLCLLLSACGQAASSPQDAATTPAPAGAVLRDGDCWVVASGRGTGAGRSRASVRT